MPHDLTIFAAKYLVFIEGLVAAAFLLVLFFTRPRRYWVRWAVALFLTIVLSYIAAQIGAAVYNDPRPFVVGHFHPLVDHAPDNGFPSDHALLAATIVAAVALARRAAAIFFAALAALVDWARVGAGIHHVSDVLGSSAIVALAAIVGYLAAPHIARFVIPYVTKVPIARRYLQLEEQELESGSTTSTTPVD